MKGREGGYSLFFVVVSCVVFFLFMFSLAFTGSSLFFQLLKKGVSDFRKLKKVFSGISFFPLLLYSSSFRLLLSPRLKQHPLPILHLHLHYPHTSIHSVKPSIMNDGDSQSPKQIITEKGTFVNQ